MPTIWEPIVQRNVHILSEIVMYQKYVWETGKPTLCVHGVCLFSIDNVRRSYSLVVYLIVASTWQCSWQMPHNGGF